MWRWGLPWVIGEGILDVGAEETPTIQHSPPGGEGVGGGLAFWSPHSSSSLSFIWCYHHHRRHASIIHKTATRQNGRRPCAHMALKQILSFIGGFTVHTVQSKVHVTDGKFFFVRTIIFANQGRSSSSMRQCEHRLV